MSPLRIGLLFILAGIVLVRTAIYFSRPAPGMPPDQIWHSMSGGSQAIVRISFCLLVYGCWRVVKGIFRVRPR